MGLDKWQYQGKSEGEAICDLISFQCPDTIPLMHFPGNLENLDAIVSSIFRSFSLVLWEKKVLNAVEEKL